jgi:hypothetical protein
MTRFVVLLAICGAAVGLGFGSVACGGGEKPPLTPDTEVKPDLGDAGTSAPAAPTAPAK